MKHMSRTATSWIEKARLLVLDFDGTLYHNLDFHQDLCSLTLELAHRGSAAYDAICCTNAILDGETDFIMPDFIQESAIRRLSGTGNMKPWREQAEAAFANGSTISFETVLKEGKKPDDAFSIADPWSACYAVTRLYGADETHYRQAFLEVRQKMLKDLIPEESLIRALLDTPAKTFLLTNSPRQTAMDFYQRLFPENLFSAFITDAKKPEGLEKVLEEAFQQGYKPGEIIAIGDHPWNDLVPAYTRGCRTVLVSPYPGIKNGPWDLRFFSIDELTQFLKAAGTANPPVPQNTKETTI